MNFLERYSKHILGGSLLIIVSSFWWTGLGMDNRVEFALLIVVLIIFFIILGYQINGKPLGILIDKRNKVSLSRMQLAVWTIIFLSCFLTMVTNNISNKKKEPLSIEIPQEIWWLLGISVTSLVGSPLLKNVRDGQTQQLLSKSEIEDLNEMHRHSMISDTELNSRLKGQTSVIEVNESIDKASFWDIFKGEEVSNSNYVDLAKVQMFFFTVVIVIAYTATLFLTIDCPDSNCLYSSFPDLDKGIIALLGISHSGYLANKGISK